MRVFLAHQSVGENILDGLRDLSAESPDVPAILDARAAPPSADSYLLHTKVGRNGQPDTKCAEFRQLLDDGLAGHVDAALLKFCYVDCDETTDVAGLFATYRRTLEDAAARYPHLTVIPVTLPLRHAEGGIGVRLRELLGRPNRAKLANRARQAFNDLVRQAWAGAPLFDLAASESTRPDGRREQFTYAGTRCDNLVAGYTDDGGHLNVEGRRRAARELLRCLGTIAPSRPASAGSTALIDDARR